MGKTKLIVLLACILIGLELVASACRPDHSIVGRWRSEAPASLLFEYLDDGTVLLWQDSRKFVVFHYKILDENSLQLFDGMGRVREYDFRISGETLIFYEDLSAGVVAEEYKRE